MCEDYLVQLKANWILKEVIIIKGIKGELNPIILDYSSIQGVNPVKSLADSAQRLNDLYYKYHSMMSITDDKQLLDIIRFLINLIFFI